MFGLVELEFRLDGRGGEGGGGWGGRVTLIFFYIIYLLLLILSCIPKIGFSTCMEVP